MQKYHYYRLYYDLLYNPINSVLNLRQRLALSAWHLLRILSFTGGTRNEKQNVLSPVTLLAHLTHQRLL